ncbi:unnamed protein product, partial [Closterium sp. NIES-54]
TTETAPRRFFNSPANGGADGGGIGSSARGAAAVPVPVRATIPRCLCKKDLESRRRKRGAWTAAEDAELRAYVAKYGAGSWKRVTEAATLKRDAQSCRLRWSSHLNPK